MDPVSLTLAALSAGVAAGATDAAKSSVVDAYEGLKDLLRSAFGQDRVADA